MLDKLDCDILNREVQFTDFEQRLIKFAIWWHDYVYDPEANDNEIRSIDAWNEFVDRLSEDAALLTAYKLPVSHLIECTISHARPASDGANESLSPRLVSYFLDLDLAVLACSREAYQVYAENIRREYIQYRIDDYRRGRAKVLRRFLQRDNIFLSATSENNSGRSENMENMARRNIKWELDGLDSGELPKG
ncbi:hypothetical protein ABW21_db0203528 [Orbilia brochopaga]|nr:hypothetical protein ABW21_db0203528 [Drechslerella brochopaga]